MPTPIPEWVWKSASRRASGDADGAREMRPRTPAETVSVLTYRMGVRDANAAGDVHGGWIMKLCDDVAVIAASRHAESRVATLAVDGLLFRNVVHTSDVVTLKATVNAAWRTSMEVGVRVEAEDLRGGEVRHTLTAYLTLVALGEDGATTAVPSLRPVTRDDKRRWHEANLRRKIRLSDPQDLQRLHRDSEALEAQRDAASRAT